MGHVAVHCCPRRCPGQGSLDHERLDEIYLYGHSRFYGDLVGLHPNICDGCSPNWSRIQHRAPRRRPCHVYITSVLCVGPDPATPVSSTRLRLEVRQADVLSTDLPSCTRDSEVQCPGLPATDGTIPESGQEGAAGTEDAETARLCFQRW